MQKNLKLFRFFPDFGCVSNSYSYSYSYSTCIGNKLDRENFRVYLEAIKFVTWTGFSWRVIRIGTEIPIKSTSAITSRITNTSAITSRTSI